MQKLIDALARHAEIGHSMFFQLRLIVRDSTAAASHHEARRRAGLRLLSSLLMHRASRGSCAASAGA